MGSDSIKHRLALKVSMFQFTLPHGERLGGLGEEVEEDVSIHAPAWGATNAIEESLPGKPVSIHAPAWGATARQGRSLRRRRVSIHAPAWGATPSPFLALLGSGVSIHAPAWGATGVTWRQVRRLRSFNSRSRMGSDIEKHAMRTSPMLFQFTLPHGERPPSYLEGAYRCTFQFTLPHGERP